MVDCEPGVGIGWSIANQILACILLVISSDVEGWSISDRVLVYILLIFSFFDVEGWSIAYRVGVYSFIIILILISLSSLSADKITHVLQMTRSKTTWAPWRSPSQPYEAGKTH